MSFAHRFRNSVLLAAASLAVLPIALSAEERWNKIDSAHFSVVGDSSHSSLRSIARTMEQFRLATIRIFPARRVVAARPLTVVVAKRDMMRRFMSSDNIEGFYSRGTDQDFIVMRGDLPGNQAVKVTIHEYQHLITRASWSAPLPRWASEGIAEFYSTFEEVDGGRRYRVGLFDAERVRTLKSNPRQRLMQFLSDDGRRVSFDDGIKTSVFYAQSWALIHFFNFGEDGKWSQKLAPFLEALSGGTTPDEAFRKTVTEDIGGFETALNRYLTLPTLGYTSFEAEPIDEARSFRQSQLSEAETQILIGTLSVDEKHAMNAIDAALASEPRSQRALSLRARRLLEFRDTAKAVEALKTAALASPGDALTCGYAMLALNLVERYQESLSTCATDSPKLTVAVAFERAIALEGLERAGEAGPFRAFLLGVPAESLGELSWRAWRYLEAGRYHAAARAASVVGGRGNDDPDRVAYMRLVHAVARCQLGECDDARKELKESVPASAGIWVQQVVRFMTAQIDADGLLRQARSDEERTEAHTYIGLDLIARGQRAPGIASLKWVLDKGSKAVREYHVAVEHYRRLQGVH